MKTLRNASFIIVANTEIEMKEMMKNLRKYMTKNKLEVNVEKTKMMVFNKRKKKSEENEINSGKEGK
jgi:mannose/fructose/N-acetylgalactosamine-specific phosphotransferase system component IIB